MKRVGAMLTLIAAVSTGLALPTWVPLVYADSQPTMPLLLTPTADAKAAAQQNRFVGEKFARTELFFGFAKPDGSVVTEEEFQQFLDQKITPRFPEGITLLTGLGQFRGFNGVIIQEHSMLLILFYPAHERRSRSKDIEEIRQAYKETFQQESVLRLDRCCEKGGF